MSLIAGAQGSKSIFADGMQVDHISENTNGHGVRVKGVTNPTTYPIIAGEIGEKITWITPPAGNTGVSSTSYVDWANANIILTAGIWMINANIQMGIVMNSGNSGTLHYAITDSSDNIQDGGLAVRTMYGQNANSSYVSMYHNNAMTIIINIATTTTYKIRAKVAGSNQASYLINSDSDGRSSFFAVRIA